MTPGTAISDDDATARAGVNIQPFYSPDLVGTPIAAPAEFVCEEGERCEPVRFGDDYAHYRRDPVVVKRIVNE